MSMFEGLFRTKVTETSATEKRNAIREAFCEHGIDYTVKCKDIYQRNIMDAAKMGQALQTKYVYSFWVKKEQAGEALWLVKELE
ncbi:MAG: hypothetical protein IJZ23_10480 [Roseburia sp.]|nr:hypothetical protein [Roseburia sp.]